jgi:hypothetical protein
MPEMRREDRDNKEDEGDKGMISTFINLIYFTNY